MQLHVRVLMAFNLLAKIYSIIAPKISLKFLQNRYISSPCNRPVRTWTPLALIRTPWPLQREWHPWIWGPRWYRPFRPPSARPLARPERYPESRNIPPARAGNYLRWLSLRLPYWTWNVKHTNTDFNNHVFFLYLTCKVLYMKLNHGLDIWYIYNQKHCKNIAKFGNRDNQTRCNLR